MNPGSRICWKALLQVDPEAARLAVLAYLKTDRRHGSDPGRVFGINGSVVYGILEKQAEGDLSFSPMIRRLGTHHWRPLREPMRP